MHLAMPAILGFSQAKDQNFEEQEAWAIFLLNFLFFSVLGVERQVQTVFPWLGKKGRMHGRGY